VKGIPVERREMWRARDLANIMGVSEGTIKRLRADGLLPQPLELNETRAKFWRAREVRAWINAGCPHPSRWTWKPAEAETLDQIVKRLSVEVSHLSREKTRLERELER
jgi:predicted DNA-binding transcriptional regulator AlpA